MRRATASDAHSAAGRSLRLPQIVHTLAGSRPRSKCRRQLGACALGLRLIARLQARANAPMQAYSLSHRHPVVDYLLIQHMDET